MSQILKLTSLTLCLSVSLFAQAKSQLEFFDSTGANSTAKIGWSGTATDGKFTIETPGDGGTGATVQKGELVAKKISTADGSGIDKIDTTKIIGFSTAMSAKASVASVNLKGDLSLVKTKADSLDFAKRIAKVDSITQTKANSASVGVSAAAVSDSLKRYSTSGRVDTLLLAKASLAGANFTGNVGIGTTTPGCPLDVSGGCFRVLSSASIFPASGTGVEIEYQSNVGSLIRYNRTASTYKDLTFNNQVRILGSNGNVGIGTPIPRGKVEIVTKLAPPTPFAQAVSGTPFIISDSGNILLTAGIMDGGSNVYPAWLQARNSGANGDVYPLLLNPNGGNVGIGTTAPRALCDIRVPASKTENITKQILTLFSNDVTNPAGLAVAIQGATTQSLRKVFVQTTETNYINGGCLLLQPDEGNVGIGDTNPGSKLAVCGDIKASGTIIGTQTCNVSDRRFKTNITPLDSSLAKVKSLQGVNYDWDRAAFPDRNFPEGKQVGLIAQEVEKVIPEVVHTDAQGYKSLSYDKLTAVLIEAVKELKKENAELRARVEKLENSR